MRFGRAVQLGIERIAWKLLAWTAGTNHSQGIAWFFRIRPFRFQIQRNTSDRKQTVYNKAVYNKAVYNKE